MKIRQLMMDFHGMEGLNRGCRRTVLQRIGEYGVKLSGTWSANVPCSETGTSRWLRRSLNSGFFTQFGSHWSEESLRGAEGPGRFFC